MLKSEFRNIYIVDSLEIWNSVNLEYDKKKDLVLTYDFGLKKYLNDLEGKALFVDKLLSKEIMNENNIIIYQFFQTFFLDKEGNDIFMFKNISFGFSFRLEIWNDYVSYCRIYLNLQKLEEIKYKKLYILSNDNLITKILRDIKLNYEDLICSRDERTSTAFYFPIKKWIDEKIRPSGIRALLFKSRDYLTYIYGYILYTKDKFIKSKKDITVFIQEYHPTKDILHKLRNSDNIKVLLINFSRQSKILDNLKERLLFIGSNKEKYYELSNRLIVNFKKNKVSKLRLTNGHEISDNIYSIITPIILSSLPKALCTLDGCIKYLDTNKVNLEILIANIGHTVTLFDMVCRNKNIPSYLIVNGLMMSSYMDESKYATTINAYSDSMKENYFNGMTNIVTLGDPRMDKYSQLSDLRIINRKKFNITIGASGFGSTSLQSYVAIEFDYLFDILIVLSKIKDCNITLKVRSNGYKVQYENFTRKYFPSLNINIEDEGSIMKLFKYTDLYISIYSQTLFEASCMGIPVIYYKKDTEILFPPFDNNSELVTASSINELVQAFYDFQNNHERYEAFLDKKIMEKYIGPLDGKNLERNIDYIHELLKETAK